jgi:hypothetical protein
MLMIIQGGSSHNTQINQLLDEKNICATIVLRSEALMRVTFDHRDKINDY